MRPNCVRMSDGAKRAASRSPTQKSGIDACISISGWRSPSPSETDSGFGTSVRVVTSSSCRPSLRAYGLKNSS